jgi:hypothetical protein
MDKDERSSGARPANLGEMLTREQAVEYLGVEARQFDPLRAQYGIGRRYRTEGVPGWYFAKSELGEIKASLEKERAATA